MDPLDKWLLFSAKLVFAGYEVWGCGISGWTDGNGQSYEDVLSYSGTDACGEGKEYVATWPGAPITHLGEGLHPDYLKKLYPGV